MAETTAPTEETFASDGLNIFFRSWHPADKPRGVIAICHGVNSHSGYYFWAAEQFVAAGFAVYALDLPGRGRSDGDRYFIDSIDGYVAPLARLIEIAKEREPGLPLFLLGHSAGGVTSCVYALEHRAGLAGFICESFAFRVYAPDFALAVLKGLSHIAPHAHVLRLPFEAFSRDPAVVKQMHDDPLLENEVQPTQTVASFARADDRIERDFALFQVPLLILHGTADKATRPDGSQLFFEKAASPDKTLKLYDGHFHDLLSDLERDVVMADILAWIDKHMPAQMPAA